LAEKKLLPLFFIRNLDILVSMQSHLQEFLKSIPVGGVPATGPGQQTEQWARIRGGVLSPHTKPHTIKRIQEVATKKEYARNMLDALLLAPPATH